jgi:hypothetical protein
LPNFSVISPNAIVPTNPPTARSDPIHEASSDVMAPVDKCDSFDLRYGRKGESQPTAHPWLREIKFTGEKKRERNLKRFVGNCGRFQL